MCKVLDFGIAKLQQDDQKLDQLETQAGTVFGTPRYMSPEQAQGVELDARSDLYSLGVILFQMLTGRAPFVDDDAVVVMAKHIKEAAPTFAQVAPKAEVPPELERVVLRALAKTPSARIQSAEQFIADLDRASRDAEAAPKKVHETTTAALTPVERPLLPPRLPRHRLAFVGLGLLGLAVTLGVWLAPRWSSVPPPSSAGASAPLVRGVPATMSGSLIQPIGSADAPVQAAAEVRTDAVTSSQILSTRPATSVSPGASPTTQLKPRSVETKGSTVGADGTRKTMEPKRPDERYGRFR